MFDSTDLLAYPKHAEAYAAYIDGKPEYQHYNQLKKEYPRSHHLSIAVFAEHDADCLDVEKEDAEPNQAPAWVRRQHARGIKRPCLYGSRSTMAELKHELAKDNISRGQVRLWVADPTGKPHIPTGFDACQFDWKAQGKNLDESLCQPGFFN